MEVFTIILQMLGWLVFLTGTVALGAWLRKNPNRRTAERTSRILHLLFWMGVLPPAFLGVFYPGLTGFDQELGLNPLPRQATVRLVGTLVCLIGAYLFVVSNVALRSLGEGASAFWLTKRLVVSHIYERTRNPMSLGFYLGAVGIGLMLGSTYMTLGALYVAIPVHVFYLKYFEEYELELRMGPSYAEYRRSVPFLIPGWLSRRS
jgi:protein-S-isoprenylcysteine O-methyltransferase Ste14